MQFVYVNSCEFKITNLDLRRHVDPNMMYLHIKTASVDAFTFILNNVVTEICNHHLRYTIGQILKHQYDINDNQKHQSNAYYGILKVCKFAFTISTTFQDNTKTKHGKFKKKSLFISMEKKLCISHW